MSFIEEIKEMANNRNDKENIVVNEIVEYFKNEINSDNFKNKLKNNYIKDAINNGKSSCDLRIEFWDYCSGCSDTNFKVSCCNLWELKGNYEDYNSKHYYKDVRLSDIHKRICSEVSALLKKKIKELGLFIIDYERQDANYRFNYYKEVITISWEM